MKKVLVICGPTSVGKTSLSVLLAKALNGEVINGDSMQVYKEMNIGTAKIKEEEKQGIEHHLFDIRNINESFSVAEFQKLVREKIDEISSKGKLPIIVGGTGLYLKAGLYDYSFQENKKVDYGLEDKTSEELFNILTTLDSQTAQTIHPNNRKRIIRAIELFYETGLGKVEIGKQQKHQPIYDVIFLGLTRPRPMLYQMIDERVDQMVEEGLVEEVKYIYENASKESTALQAIGYKELFGYFENQKTLEQAITEIKMNTHKFAKRQYTWFNHQMDVKWIDVQDKSKQDVLKEAKELLKGWC